MPQLNLSSVTLFVLFAQTGSAVRKGMPTYASEKKTVAIVVYGEISKSAAASQACSQYFQAELIRAIDSQRELLQSNLKLEGFKGDL